MLNTPPKEPAIFLLEKIRTCAEEIIVSYQCAYGGGRLTIDKIFTMMQLLKKYWELSRYLHQLFVDFKRAYNTHSEFQTMPSNGKTWLAKKLIKLT